MGYPSLVKYGLLSVVIYFSKLMAKGLMMSSTYCVLTESHKKITGVTTLKENNGAFISSRMVLLGNKQDL